MPRNTRTDDLNQHAFEFVLGTLRGAQRQAFAREITVNHEASHQVHFWEEQLMALPEPPHIQPAQQTWQRIATRLSAETPVNSATSSLGWRLKNWLIPSALGSICTLLLVFIVFTGSAQSGSEYIAVLNDEQGRPA